MDGRTKGEGVKNNKALSLVSKSAQDFSFHCPYARMQLSKQVSGNCLPMGAENSSKGINFLLLTVTAGMLTIQ